MDGGGGPDPVVELSSQLWFESSQNAHGKATWIGAYNPTKHLAATLPIKKSALARSYHTIMGWLQYLQNYRDDCSISDKAVWELQVNGIS